MVEEVAVQGQMVLQAAAPLKVVAFLVVPVVEEYKDPMVVVYLALRKQIHPVAHRIMVVPVVMHETGLAPEVTGRKAVVQETPVVLVV